MHAYMHACGCLLPLRVVSDVAVLFVNTGSLGFMFIEELVCCFSLSVSINEGQLLLCLRSSFNLVAD